MLKLKPHIILKPSRLLLLISVLTVVFAAGASAQTLSLTGHQESYPLGKFLHYLKDDSGQLSFEEISSPAYSKQFVHSKQKVLNFGFSPATYWVRFEMQNDYPAADDWLLEISFPVMDEIEFWYQDRYDAWQVTKLGDRYPFEARDILHRNFVIPVHLRDMDIHAFYLKFRTRTAVQMPMTVYQTHFFYENEIRSEIAHGVFYGFMGVMMLYNLFIFFSLRDKNYLFYVFSILASTAYFTAKSGHAYQYLWGDWPWLGDHFILLTIGAWAATAALFAKHFLEVKKHLPFAARLLDLVILAGLVEIVMTLSMHYTTVSKFGTNLIGINTLLILGTGVACWIKGNKSARFFVVAWTVYLLGTLLLVLKTFGVLSSNFVTDYAAEIGSALEVVLLSLSLSDKFSLLRLEKERAQAQALAIQQEANEELENKVQERTSELYKQKDILELRNHEINKQKEEIESSIKYAERIQRAMLPDRQGIMEIFPESFILFRPRDIVSGDFYWASRVGNKMFIAAADCTGHGVPGSFMSMLGTSLFSEIVKVRKISDTAEILNLLHLGVKQTLRQDDTNNRDGMDLALCAINATQTELEFAGAKNPLVYITGGELTQIKGDSMPIGGRQKESVRSFGKHLISLDAPTNVFIFTDGFQDQFGGPEERKFMIKRLKQLFLEIHKAPAETQKSILEKTFEEWMVKSRQIDDVLIIGFLLNPKKNTD